MKKDQLIKSLAAEENSFFKNGEPLDTYFEQAIQILVDNREQYCKGDRDEKKDFAALVKPLLDLEKLNNTTSKGTKWKVVIEMPHKDGKYFNLPVVQFCSGAPAYERLVINFEKDGFSSRVEKTCVEEKPDLSVISSKKGPDGEASTLQQTKQFYDEAGVQRIAILGLARVSPHDEKSSDRDWAIKYTDNAEKNLNEFLNYMEEQKVLYTTVNGGWAGILENSMGMPMISNLIGVVHEHEDGHTFPPITVMPACGAYDRVTTRSENYHHSEKSPAPHIPTFFEIDGQWGDDSKYLAGLSTGLVVFEPYGFWTNIEISNGLAQNKPVAIIANPDSLGPKGKYNGKFAGGNKFIEESIALPDGRTNSYRVYKNGSDAAKWINDCYKTQLGKTPVILSTQTSTVSSSLEQLQHKAQALIEQRNQLLHTQTLDRKLTSSEQATLVTIEKEIEQIESSLLLATSSATVFTELAKSAVEEKAKPTVTDSSPVSESFLDTSQSTLDSSRSSLDKRKSLLAPRSRLFSTAQPTTVPVLSNPTVTPPVGESESPTM